MSRSQEVRLQFGAEERLFRLASGEWQKVQEASDYGPIAVLAHLAHGLDNQRQVLALFPAMVDELGRLRAMEPRAVLYHGLVGGGMAPNDAGRLVRELVDQRPLMEQVQTAFLVALAGCVGVEDERLGEPKGRAEKGRRRSPTGRSAGSTSTAVASSPDTAPTRSTAGRSGRSPRSTSSAPATATAKSPRPPARKT